MQAPPETNEGELHDVGVVGLGVMGGNLARNFARHGLRVIGYQRDAERARAFAAEHPEARLGVAEDMAQLVRRLARPRVVLLLVPAGAPVDAVLDELDPLLEADDIVVDAGNSLYTDTERRQARAAERPWRFVGMGVSGGAEGALRGPSMMPGGDLETWERLRPLLEPAAAHSAYGSCVAHCGRGAAGHFVKMVHNGIEYAVMQLLAESATFLRGGLGQSACEAAEVFARWNAGELEGYLVEITAAVLRVVDPRSPDGAPLVDAILDSAGQKGTGRWTARAALELGVAAPTIAAAVDARVQSSQKALRVRGAELLGRPEARLAAVTVDELRDALFVATLASYSQGFALLRAGNEELGFGSDLAEVARIWTGGCILRARLLGDVMSAYRSDPTLELLLFAPELLERVRAGLLALRRVLSAATAAGVACPAHAASASWIETLATAHGSAGLIQAQRDAFGSHTYERLDAPGVREHTDWLGSERD